MEEKVTSIAPPSKNLRLTVRGFCSSESLCLKGFALVHLFFCLFVFVFFFLGPHPQHMEVPKTQPQQCRIQAMSATTCTTAHGNMGSLTRWTRPGTEPKSSWILVRFISTAPQWKLLVASFIPISPPGSSLRSLGVSLSFPLLMSFSSTQFISAYFPLCFFPSPSSSHPGLSVHQGGPSRGAWCQGFQQPWLLGHSIPAWLLRGDQ